MTTLVRVSFLKSIRRKCTQEFGVFRCWVRDFLFGGVRSGERHGPCCGRGNGGVGHRGFRALFGGGGLFGDEAV